MADPPAAPVDASCAEPTVRGNLRTRRVHDQRSIGGQRPVKRSGWDGRRSTNQLREHQCSVSGPLPPGSMASPKGSSRAVVEDEPSATNWPTQSSFSALAVCGMEPANAIPDTVSASCSIEKPTPVIANSAETSAPLFWPTWNVAMPLPVPEIAPVNVTQLGIFVMLQEQFEVVVIVEGSCRRLME